MRRFARTLKAGDHVYLEGSLGAGKSTCARGILEGLGAKGAHAGSPSFPIVHEYACSNKIRKAMHIDLYRLESQSELQDSGIEELWRDSEAVLLIEWASKFPVFLEDRAQNYLIELSFTQNPNERAVRLRRPSAAKRAVSPGPYPQKPVQRSSS